MVVFSELGKVLLQYGVMIIVIDLYEFVNVVGIVGIQYLIDDVC